jgi:hypothetical protein
MSNSISNSSSSTSSDDGSNHNGSAKEPSPLLQIARKRLPTPPPLVAPLIAGSMGGAIGVFVSFPLDALTIKMQLYDNMKLVTNKPVPTTSGEKCPMAKRPARSVLSVAKEIYTKEGKLVCYSRS